MRGKPWSVEDEKKLKDWVTSGVSVDALVFSFDGQYTKDAIYKKIEQLGLEVVDEEKKNVLSTTSLELPKELPSIEETRMKLTAALAVLEKPGLEKSDILRLRGIISGCKVYKELLADYLNYRGLETEMIELRRNMRNFQKPKAFRPNRFVEERARLRLQALEIKSQRLSKVETLKNDPIEFFRQVLGVEPTDYQKELIELFQKNQFVAARWSRQAGKSFNLRPTAQLCVSQR